MTSIFTRKQLFVWTSLVALLALTWTMGPQGHAADPSSAEENAQGWVSLFNGKDLTGWTLKPNNDLAKKQWWVENGTIMCEIDGGPGSDLWTNKSYTDFEMTLDYKTLTKDYDTGVFVRGKTHQVQIGISGSLKKDMTACIYAPADKKGGYPGQTDKVSKVNKVNEWNTLRIVLKGKTIKTFLNGQEMVEYEGIKIADKGPIGLQLHGKRTMKVAFRDIKIKPLEK